LDTVTATKPLGEPIAGEALDSTVVCPVHGAYGLYHNGVVRNDVCLQCERRKARAGDQAAWARVTQLERLRQNADKAQQDAAARAQRLEESQKKGAKWEPWERQSAKGFSMGADFTRPVGRPAP